jgi:hypothetical protein
LGTAALPCRTRRLRGDRECRSGVR